MKLNAIYAQVSCSDLAGSIEWFTTLLERGPDVRPMKGLAEWHHGHEGGLQLFENSKDAGHSTLTLIVGAVREEQQRLSNAGLKPGPIEAADYTTITRLNDPDGNLIVLAQPSRP